MTVSSTSNRRDFNGNGSSKVFPCLGLTAYDVEHVVVVRVAADGTITQLSRPADFSVTGVNTQAGITVTTVAAPAAGESLIVRVIQPLTQPTDIKNQGQFYPEVHERVFDRLTKNDQQQQADIDRAVKVPFNDPRTPDEFWQDLLDASDDAQQAAAASEAALYEFKGKYYGALSADPAVDPNGDPVTVGDLYFNTLTGRLRVYDVAIGAWIEQPASTLATPHLFSGDDTTDEFELTRSPINVGNVFVSIGGVDQRPGVDYQIVGPTLTTIRFTTPPQAGTDNVSVVVLSTLDVGITDASNVQYRSGNASDALDKLTFYAPDRPAAEVLAAELGDGATVWIDSDEANGGVRTRNTVIGGALTSAVSDNAAQILYTHAQNVAALAGLPKPSLPAGKTVTVPVAGFYSAGDGGGGQFYWQYNSNETPVPGMIINPAGNVGAGRWKRAFSGAVDVRWTGAIEGGEIASDSAIQTAIDKYRSVKIDGKYLLESPFSIPGNREIDGDGGWILWDASINPVIGVAEDVDDVLISGLGFESSVGLPAESVAALSFRSARSVTLNCCKSRRVPLVSFRPKGTFNTYDAANIDESSPDFNGCSDVHVISPDIDGPGATSMLGNAAINFNYCLRWSVIGGSIRNCGDGIQWWGGDSNPAVNGGLANERKCRGGVISGVTVNTVYGGAIWGSMGKDIAVAGCVVDGSQDVGIDFEGCENCTASGGVVRNCKNGNLTAFWYNRDVYFVGITSTQELNDPIGRVYNASNNELNKSVSFIGIIGSSKSGISSIDTANGPVEQLTIQGCKLTNVRLSAEATNGRFVDICNNELRFTVAAGSAINGISVNNLSGSGRAKVKGNIIESIVAQPAGSKAIRLRHSDFNSVCRFTASNNETFGFETDIEAANASTNAGISPVFIIKDNVFGNSAYLRTEGGAANSVVRLDGNVTASGSSFPTAIPTTQRWDVNQRIFFSAPTAGGHIGAVCVAAGTPGTWKNFGAIAA